MRTLLLGRKMKATDAKTIQEIGIPSMVLMERAAMAVAAEAEKAAKKDEIVWAVCGSGNNGADGIAAARMLHLKGYPVCIYMAGDENRGTVELKTQLSIARKLGISVKPWQEIETEKKGKHCCVIIDAVFGVGLGRPVEGNYKRCLDDLNQIREQEHTFCVAVDIPSGIHADTGAVMGTALKADVTVTFGWEKMGTALYPGRSYAGKVLVKDIGFPEMALEGEEEEGGRPERAFAYEKKDLCHIPERKADSNKGTFGKVLIAAGSAGMCGAAYLSALTAYRAGAGLVKILTVEENRPILQGLLPEAIIASYTPDQLLQGREEFKEMIEEQMKWASVVVLGPGLGSEPYVEYLVEDILTSAYVPVILDADGLNTIASHPYLTSYYTENIIITPHLGEMARLTGQTISQLKEDLVGAASAYASRYGVTYVEYLVEDILTSAYVPVILDADGLNTIASHPYLTSYYTENIIITPHLGEMARLTGQTISQLKEDLVGAASAYASRYGVTCVLKDAATVVAGQEGGLYINTSGCSAMAKAGSGDVLTGTIAGLLAIGMEEEEAARMGVYVHGLAGEKAAGAGSHSLLATELSQAVGDVMDEAVRRNG